MLRPEPPMSNAERQRLFRERHPGYYAKLHARRRAGHKALIAAARAQLAASSQPPADGPAPTPLPAELPGLSASDLNALRPAA